MKIIIVYDNNVEKTDAITDIIGNKTFSDVVIDKKTLENLTKEKISRVFKDVIWKRIDSPFEYSDIADNILNYDENTKILHLYANYYISDIEQFSLSLQKIFYIDNTYKLLFDKKLVGVMFNTPLQYKHFCKNILKDDFTDSITGLNNSFEVAGLLNLSNIKNFIKCITGNFDSRYFNSLKEDEYTITKTSTDKLKIKKEYSFYNLLPEDMKFWFVMPFNYIETDTNASYTMERLNMTDLGIKWVHGSIDENEFQSLLDKYMFFFNSRHTKNCSQEEYKQISDNLYIEKVLNRIKDLKNKPSYPKIKNTLSVVNLDIDELVSKYILLKEKIEKKNNYPCISVIGHGDPGFANTLYNKATQTLKFIDPKGALKEEDLWTNPYYDIAKLSHCICGRYDFFNSALFDIRINEEFNYVLDIPFDNSVYKSIFKNKLKENNIDYDTVRIYEVSLFLSMLPLHIDNPYKVFGFILNLKNILEEIDKNV